VRPVNLIPLDERRGTARGGSAATGIRVYILLGGLGAALICVLALVLTANSVNNRKQELAKVQVQQQGVKEVADALRPYGQFAQLQQARQQQIASIISSRFDWERSLRQLSLAIPANVWILNLDATLDPSVEVEGSGGGGGDLQTLRQQSPAPAFAITGCAFSHHAVARMMVRMQNLDDVTSVRFADSARKEEDQSATAQPAQPQTGQAAEQDATDCVGSNRITKFDILVVFGNAPSAAGSAPSPDAAAAAPSSTTQNLAKAQTAGEQAQAASSSAAASATSATGGAK
jgi:Tfp pilus assembly protein PilN